MLVRCYFFAQKCKLLKSYRGFVTHPAFHTGPQGLNKWCLLPDADNNLRYRCTGCTFSQEVCVQQDPPAPARSKLQWDYKPKAKWFLDLKLPLISQWLASSIYPAFKEKNCQIPLWFSEGRIRRSMKHRL